MQACLYTSELQLMALRNKWIQYRGRDCGCFSMSRCRAQQCHRRWLDVHMLDDYRVVSSFVSPANMHEVGR